jgi:hypothetical protein
VRGAKLLCAALALSGCTLFFDRDRHRGGDAGLDAPGLDAPRTDAPELDAPELDAAEPDVPGADVPELPRDAGTDAPPDAGPSDCASDAECPASADCVAGHCTVCAPAAITPLEVFADPNLRDDVDLVIGREAGAAEVVIALRGAGTDVFLHRTRLGGPAPAPGSLATVTDALFDARGLPGVEDVEDVALGTSRYLDGRQAIDVAVLAARPSRLPADQLLVTASYAGDLSIETLSPTAIQWGPPTTMLAPIAVGSDAVLLRVLETSPSRRLTLRALGSTDLTFLANVLESGVPEGSIHGIETAGDFTLLSASTALAWDRSFSFASPLVTADEPVSIVRVGAGSFLAAFPNGRDVRLRQIDCAGGSCAFSTTARADLRTDAEDVAWVRIAALGTELVVLSGERTLEGHRVVLRVLRPDLTPVALPAGPFVVLDVSSSPFAAGRIDAATDAGALTAAALWVRPGTTRRLMLASVPVRCP